MSPPRRRGARALAAALLLALALWPGLALAGPAGEGGLGFALLVVRSQAEAEQAWRPLLVRLSAWLGVAVEPHWYSDYAGAVWAMRTGRDQFGHFGNKAAIEAVDKAGGRVFAAPAGPRGPSVYHSVLVVRRDARFASLEALLEGAGGATLALGDPNSTSGTVVPRQTLFHPRGIEPRERFLRVTAGTHPDNLAAVEAGRVDAALVSSKAVEALARTRPEQAAALRELWRSPPIPADPLLWRDDLAPPLKSSVRAFFLQLGRPAPGKSAATLAAERAELARLDLAESDHPDQGGFVAADDRYLLPVRRLDLLESRWRLTHGPAVGAAEAVDTRLAEIDRRLADLDSLPAGADPAGGRLRE